MRHGLFRAERDFRRLTINLYDLRQSMEPGSYVEPTAHMSETDSQVLMDDLWAAGVRPTEGAGTAGSMAAAQRHLEHVTRLLDTVLPKALRG